MSSTERGAPVVVPAAVLEGLEAVRDSGRTNMLDRPAVAILCSQLGYLEAAIWALEHRDAYGRGFFQGFVAAAGEEGSDDA